MKKKTLLTAALVVAPLLIGGAAIAAGGKKRGSRKRSLTAALAIEAVGEVFPYTMTDARRDGVRQLFDAFAKYGDGDVRKFAYILATCQNENGFVSLREQRANRDKNPLIWKLQEEYWYGGYYGRGLSQLTGKDNYVFWSKRKGIDLVGYPDLALNSKVGAEILVEGMMQGLFRGKGGVRFSLGLYISGDKKDYKGARDTVNGYLPGVAESIAANAEKYERALLNKTITV